MRTRVLDGGKVQRCPRCGRANFANAPKRVAHVKRCVAFAERERESMLAYEDGIEGLPEPREGLVTRVIGVLQ